MNAVVNVQEAKAHLSQLIARAEKGEQVVIGRAGKPVVTLVPVTTTPAPRRTFGTMPSLVVPDDFDASLPDDELAAWE